MEIRNVCNTFMAYNTPQGVILAPTKEWFKRGIMKDPGQQDQLEQEHTSADPVDGKSQKILQLQWRNFQQIWQELCKAASCNCSLYDKIVTHTMDL